MTAGKMHPDEWDINTALVRRLLVSQFPAWADLPLRAVPSGGTDNAIYRLSNDMAVRLPRITWATRQVQKEAIWLSKLAPHLTLEIPVPIATGKPDLGYPWDWAICRWLDGENAALERLSDPCKAAIDLAQFILALQKIDTANGPLAGEHNFFRGVPLIMRDDAVRAAIKALDGLMNTDLATATWETALQATVWTAPPVWLHGDLQSGNLLAVNGQLSAVIDFGGLGVGDPACDLIVAWNLFDGESRDVFRSTLAVDEATWERGRGWALSIGLIALPYYLNTSPAMVRYARHTIAAVLGDKAF